jgi:hypothetical protein
MKVSNPEGQGTATRKNRIGNRKSEKQKAEIPDA